MIPMAAYVGITPIRKVATPMISMVATRVFFRPIRSPMCPKIRPPTGRATKPTAKVANASSVPTAGSLLGKNNFGNTMPGRRAVQEEVVPLDGGADEARCDDGPKFGLGDFLDGFVLDCHSDSRKISVNAFRVTGRGTTASWRVCFMVPSTSMSRCDSS